MSTDVKRKRPLGPGRPPLDTKMKPEDLSPREWQYCHARAAGFLSEQAGQMLDIPAGKQQVEKWDKNPAIQKAIAKIQSERPLDNLEMFNRYRSFVRLDQQGAEHLLRVWYESAAETVKAGKIPWKHRLELFEKLTQRADYYISKLEKGGEKEDEEKTEKPVAVTEFSALLAMFKKEIKGDKSATEPEAILVEEKDEEEGNPQS